MEPREQWIQACTSQPGHLLSAHPPLISVGSAWELLGLLQVCYFKTNIFSFGYCAIKLLVSPCQELLVMRWGLYQHTLIKCGVVLS